MLVSSREAEPLCVTQEALIAIETQLCRSGAPWRYGLLAGLRCICPESQHQYVLIDSARPCDPCDEGGDVIASMALHLTVGITEAERTGRTPLGYFLGGPAVDGHAAAGALSLLRMLFPEAWQVLLARDVAEAGGGAFIRIEPAHVRAYCTPFIELLPGRRRRKGEPPRSAIAWPDYTATEVLAEGTVGPDDAPGLSLPRRLGKAVRTLVARSGPAVTAPPRPDAAMPAAPPPPAAAGDSGHGDSGHGGAGGHDRHGAAHTPAFAAVVATPVPVFQPSPTRTADATPPPAEVEPGSAAPDDAVAAPDAPAASEATAASEAPARHELVRDEPVRDEPVRDEPAAEPPMAALPAREAPSASRPVRETRDAEAPVPEAPRREVEGDDDTTLPGISFPFLVPAEDQSDDASTGGDAAGDAGSDVGAPPTRASWTRRVRRLAGWSCAFVMALEALAAAWPDGSVGVAATLATASCAADRPATVGGLAPAPGEAGAPWQPRPLAADGAPG